MLKKTGVIEGLSRDIQKKVDSLFPKIHASISKTMEIAIKSILGGINLIPIDWQSSPVPVTPLWLKRTGKLAK